ncbi:MAG: cytidine deaminase [Vicinamibacteria bacterium]
MKKKPSTRAGSTVAPPLAGLSDYARDARELAFAPYSKFRVGAALLTEGGEIITGCNVESATYGLTLCAERIAVFKAVSEGFTKFSAIAVVADAHKVTPPCGACRQVLWELCGDLWVQISDLKGHKKTMRMSTLLPEPFDKRFL